MERLRFADGTRAYVLGAGSENPDALSKLEVQALTGSGQLVVLGDNTQTLSLDDGWEGGGQVTIGTTTLNSFQNGDVELLVLDGIAVTGPSLLASDEVLTGSEPVVFLFGVETLPGALPSETDPLA